MVPVDKRVLTRLSPSVPGGRVSTLTVIVGFAVWKAFARSVANFVAAGSFPPAINEMVVGPLEPPLALDEQATTPPSASGTSAATAKSRRGESLDAGLMHDSCRVEDREYEKKGAVRSNEQIQHGESFHALHAR